MNSITDTQENNIKEELNINLGCGNKIMENYINIDVVQLPGVDLVISLEDAKLPFQNNSVKTVVCDHILEHIDNFLFLMEEIYRICKPNAVIHVYVPYYKYEGSFRDPTHKRFFSERSFDYFSPYSQFNYYSKARFEVLECKLTNSHKIKRFRKEDIFLKFLPFKKFFSFFIWNIYTEIYFLIKVIK